MEIAEAERLIAERGWFWARADADSAIGAKCVRVDGVVTDLDPPRVLWSAQPLWFGDAGAGSGIWEPNALTPLPAGEEPPWRERWGT